MQETVSLMAYMQVPSVIVDVCRFGPGSVVLLEDVSGKGHVTRVVGHGPSSGAFVQLRE